MTDTLSHRFITVIAPRRDDLYARALSKANNPAAAESLFRDATCAAFAAYAAADGAPAAVDICTALEKAIPADAPIAPAAMPADIWARIAAAVQLEAARTAHAAALNPDSVLLRPDPLLAPKRAAPRRDDPSFDWMSPSRLVVVSMLAVAVGIVATLYILDRPSSSPRPATAPASAAAPSATAPLTTPATPPARL